MDEYNGNQLRYPPNRFLSGGYRYPVFEQQGSEVKITPQKAAHHEPQTPPGHPVPHLFSRPRYNAEIQRFDELAEKWIKTQL